MASVRYVDEAGWYIDSTASILQDAIDNLYNAVALKKEISLSVAQALVDAQLNVVNLTQEGKQWFNDHPGAKQLFELSIEDIDALIADWDLSSLPAQTRNEMRLTIRALIASVRVLAHQLDLID